MSIAQGIAKPQYQGKERNKFVKNARFLGGFGVAKKAWGRDAIMEIKITTLVENTIDDNKMLICEHGLSLYIEAYGLNILFDTGQTDAFIENARQLGRDLNQLDYILISHGHYDHSSGLKILLNDLKKSPSLIVGDGFFKPKFKIMDASNRKYTGNSFDENYILEQKIPLIKVEAKVLHLSESVMVFHHFDRKNDFEKRNEQFYFIENELAIEDDFEDEIALVIASPKGLIVIVGCSHVGIVNILQTIRETTGMPIYAVVGGTHLVEADEERIQKTVTLFHEMNIKLIAVSHCTGELGVLRMQQEFADRFVYNNTGHVIAININTSHAELAKSYFKEGYNCAQSVFLAFHEECGLNFETALKMSSSFGAGMGRLREVCGAVSGMFMVAGMLYGYTDPKDHKAKTEHYERIQYLAKEFEERNKSIICRELLGLKDGKDGPEPELRTTEYYKKRPCVDLVGLAADIMEAYIMKVSV